MALPRVLVVALLAGSFFGGCRCGRVTGQRDGAAPQVDVRIVPRGDLIPLIPLIPLMPALRDPGPAQAETAEELAAEELAARAFTRKLVAGGLDRREVTALADIRGYRLYRRRFFGRAHAWFRAAVATDPSFELSLYNAARTAALLGRFAEARQFLARLAARGTPLARSRDRLARTDPDLAALFQRVHIDAGAAAKTR